MKVFCGCLTLLGCLSVFGEHFVVVAADMHHLEEGVLVAQVHVRDDGASGSVARHTFVARNDDIAFEVGLRLNNQ
jgi:hypothetical protein